MLYDVKKQIKIYITILKSIQISQIAWNITNIKEQNNYGNFST